MKTYITQGFYGFGSGESACAGVSAVDLCGIEYDACERR